MTGPSTTRRSSAISANRPQVGFVVPTLDEERRLPGLLGDLAKVELPHDVVVADGGSADETVARATAGGARVVQAPRGRGSQLNAGAGTVRGAWLCFLHADVRLPADARAALVRTVRDTGAEAAVWRLRIDAEGVWYRALEFGALLRDRLGGLPYGDQGFVVRRTLFESVGGFPEIPIMEDVALVRTVRRRARIVRLRAPVVVSARRWRREGPVRGWLRNIALVSAYLAGASPERLARWYRPERGVG